jgi:hypothetical protein
VAFQSMHTTCNEQIRVTGTSISSDTYSDVYHFFVLGIFMILSTMYFEIFN